MDGSDVTEVCRLCPANGKTHALLNVFDERISVKNNMKEVILVTTGIEILENDLVSKKICQRCCNITLKMFQFRQDALKQDRTLKEKCSQYLGDKGIRLPNTCITIKQERLIPSIKHLKNEPATESCSKIGLKDILHPSITFLYQTFPHLKLPKSCVNQNMTPVVSLPMGDVEKYFVKKNLDMKKFIYKTRRRSQNKEQPKKVAKKRTTMPSKQKTIAPLKISKKLFGNHIQSVNKLENYFCTSVQKEKGERKRSASFSDFEKKVKNKIVEENEHLNSSTKSIYVAESVISPAVSTKQNESSVTPVQLPVAETPSVNQSYEKEGCTPEHSEDSRDSLTSNTSIRTTSTIFNREPINSLESCGLTPTVTATKSQTLLVCNLCGSVHNNAFELKRHSIKHMVCQFCKRRFKSLDAKQDHIDYDCAVKKIMNSSSPIISLEQIHLNLDIRKKYKQAFSAFEPIAGLEQPEPVEEVIVKAVSPLLPIHQDNLIVVSDDDEIQCLPPDPLSGISTPAAHMVPPENVIYKTVSIIKPDVRIKNSRLQYKPVPNTNLSDKKVVTDLVELFKSNCPKVEKMSHTDLPTNRDIKINHSEGTCEFKNLKEQLLVYKVPINVNYGAFHVGYQFKRKLKPNHKKAHWSTLPIVNLKKTNTQNSLSTNQSTDKNATLSKTRQSVNISSSPMHQSTPSVSSTTPTIPPQIKPTIPPQIKPTIPPQTKPTIPPQNKPHTSSATTIPPQVKPSTAVCPPAPIILNSRITSQSVTNQIPVNFSSPNSATPLLQRYALSVASSSSSIPVANTSIPSQRALANTPFNNRIAFHNSTGSSSLLLNNAYSRQNSLPLAHPYSKTPPAYYQVPGNHYMSTTNSASTSVSTTPTSRLPGNQPSSSAGNTTVTQVASSESSKFRVKNVWELQ